ncbi:hypothetical protein QO002_000466 [Pararhizobium capsulatum DSM 1112]|uniref:Uncharacterized protein n=1 Tax=Pararhizobium capsulatum DSM 1112 TaxID=1121113 RepID=A0ABU0BJA1_9HYPH|nr:hypothetical protein [Pararhizobium capsulatum]MDQ0318328.1 hypothetical protein [Pararhizobium capsulatum DSM 1112]
MYQRLLLALCLFAYPAICAAQEPAYSDDRSDGAALVRSLYNAIARKEYARAYSYFSDKSALADYRTFAEGYADTVTVEVKTGTVTPEGAAGSLYMPVPVAVRSVDKAGKEHFFAGCYVTRMADAAIQEPPFTPLLIDSAELEETDGPLDTAVPAKCHPPS